MKWLIFLSVFLSLNTPTTHAEPKISCLKRVLIRLTHTQGEETLAAHPRKIENLDDMIRAFSSGLVPDLNNPSQRNAFEIYRKMKLGNPDTNLNTNTMDEVAKAIKQHPELEKESFREFKLEVQERSYPVTKELSTYLDSQVKSAGQTRSNLFQVEANSGYWKKIFQYEEPPVSPISGGMGATKGEQLSKEIAKQIKEEAQKAAKARWSTFLDSKLSPKLRAELTDTGQSPDARATALFRVLHDERTKMLTQGKDVRPISQAIVDLIHTIGYHDPAIAKALRSPSGLERLTAFRRVLDERDRFAMALGFHDHFAQVLKDFGVTVPTGMPTANGVTKTLNELEQGIMAGSTVLESQATTRTIRHLSLTESPFRSCLGGSDCSSRTYLTRALDPNYHYFTITDETGASSGHITVVLGDATLNGKPVKMAFIDKVQNVPNSDLPEMIEGVRRSVEEKGYRLALPDDVGDHSGLSNEDVTRSFVKQNIKTDPDQPLLNFKLHDHSYSFPNAYSRADKALPSHAVAPLKSREGTEIKRGAISLPWKTGDLDLDRLVQSSIKLKHSPNVEDRMRYIPSMKAIKLAGLKVDSEFDQVLAKWMGDAHEPFQLRKQALIAEWTENSKPLPDLLRSFDRSDQIQLIQNFMDIPRFRALVLKDKNSLAEFIVTARGNKKVRDALIGVYSAGQKNLRTPVLERVLDAPDISDAAAVALVRQIKMSIGSPDVEEILKIQKLAHGTSIDSWLKSELLSSYASGFSSDASLGRALAKCLGSPESKDSAIHDFGSRLLALAEDPKNARVAQFKVVKAFQEITKLQREDTSLREFSKAATSWMRSTQTSPELKAEFLLSQFGSKNAHGDHLFEVYRNEIPRSQLEVVMNKIDSEANLETFEKAAVKSAKNDASKSALRTFLEDGKLESFEFRAHTFPAGGKRVKMGSPATEAGRETGEDLRDVTLTKSFEMQTTPVTQLQWSLVMGENPSKFKTGGQVVKINGVDIPMNANRPVEQVSWDDVQKYIQRLNELDPKYHYRLPTEAEWEHAARSGTDTAYSFGDNSEELADHAWYSQNAGNQTHDVATLKPNPAGLYDMHGNVWEWVQDWYEAAPPARAVDPIGPASGSYRVLRGGGWGSAPLNLRSAQRNNLGPGGRGNSFGFRLVRTPR